MAAPLRTEETVVGPDHLVALARNGDLDAFGELYRTHAPRVRSVLRAHVASDDVHDLAHDTFLIALRRIRDVRDPKVFAGWLSAIARNVARAHHRSSRIVEPLNDNLVAVDSSLDDAIECDRVMNALDALPDTYRAPLSMRLVDGMSGEAIAHELGLSHGAVRVSLHRGLKLLRQRLDIVVTAVALFVVFGTVATFGRALRPWMLVTMDPHAVPQITHVQLGDSIITDSVSSARLNVGMIGRAEIKPRSRVKIVATSPTDYRLLLERGEIRARIWAPPRFFKVQTQNALAVDLGCIYTLRVEEDGSTLLRVEKGEVELQGRTKSIRVREGESAVIRPSGESRFFSAKPVGIWERWK